MKKDEVEANERTFDGVARSWLASLVSHVNIISLHDSCFSATEAAMKGSIRTCFSQQCLGYSWIGSVHWYWHWTEPILRVCSRDWLSSCRNSCCGIPVSSYPLQNSWNDTSMVQAICVKSLHVYPVCAIRVRYILSQFIVHTRIRKRAAHKFACH